MLRKVSLAAAAALLAACSSGGTTSPAVQANLVATLKIACQVDKAVVPVAQPIVATIGPAGQSVANADLLVHPIVVGACAALNGTPQSVSILSTAVTAPAPAPAPATTATPAPAATVTQ